MTSSRATGKATARENQSSVQVSLTRDEKEILNWSHEKRLEEFQKINPDIDRQVLESKLLYLDSLTVDNGEILSILRLNPKLSWEKARDVFFGEPVDGYTSTFHGLEEIKYPENFWKAIVENEREKLITL